MASPWFKAPSDLMQDYRFFGLSVADQRHYFCLLMAKSSGLLDQDFERSDAEFAHAAREALIANFLNISKVRVGKIKRALLLAGLIDDEWQPLDWDVRYGPGAYRTAVEQQEAAKSNADRQREYRERKKSTVTDERNGVTDERNARYDDRNATVTDERNAVTDERNGVTDSVTDDRNVFPLSYEEGRSKKTDTEADETACTTGTSPVVPRAQAHATPTAAPPVETEEKPEDLAEPPIAEPGKTEPVPEAEPAKPEKPPKAGRKTERGSRLPDGWQLPKAWGDWALGERPDMNPDDVRREATCFANFWHAKSGQNARKLNWEATWQNWILRANGKPHTLPHARASPRPNGVLVASIPPDMEQEFAIAEKNLFGVVIDEPV